MGSTATLVEALCTRLLSFECSCEVRYVYSVISYDSSDFVLRIGLDLLFVSLWTIKEGYLATSVWVFGIN